MSSQRRLSAILAADVVGYSRHMARDEQATVRALNERRAIFAERAAACGGRIVNAPGDSVLAEFPSVVEAVECAVSIQREIAARNSALADPDARMQFRIGINLGDVIVEDDGSIYGDGVNIAARLESLADYGGIALSASAYDQVRDRVQYRIVDRGSEQVKNIARPVRVYAVDMSAIGVKARRKAFPRRAALWVAGAAVVVVAAWFALQFGTREAPQHAATIAVLPFANHSADPKREFFSDGLTEDIINALGRFPAVRVIAYNTVQTYKMRVAPPEQVMRELGVRYLVQGSVREAGGTLRINVELSDAAKGTLLWSERYDGSGKDVFTMQDRIVGDIVGTLAVKLSAIEQQRAAMKAPENLEAYELVLRARERMRVVDRAANREARTLIAQALKLSPDYAEAHAANAYAEFQRAVFGWIEDPAEGLRRTEDAARRALAIDAPGANARALAILGNVHTVTGNYEAALADAERALKFNPSDALAHSLRGGILLWTGRIEESIAASEAARRFDPRLPPEGMFNLALAYYLAGRYRDAAQTVVAVEPQGRTVFLHAVHAAALAQLGDAEGARRAAEEVRRSSPFFEVKTFGQRLQNAAHREKTQEGLAKAGLR